MLGNNVLGLIFTYTFGGDGIISSSNTGALPFGAKYDLIDFPLSNMVNAGIKKVGIITDDNYGPLMEHVGSGEEWNLSHKRQGLFILPPYGPESDYGKNRIKSLYAARSFLEKSQEDYVLLVNSETVCNMDYKLLFLQHERTGADITLVCRFGRVPEKKRYPLFCSFDSSMRVRNICFDAAQFGKTCYGIGMVLIRRRLLLKLITDCVSRNLCDFKNDLILRNYSKLKTYAYTFCGFAKMICSEKDYFEANMSILNPSLRNQLFDGRRPIYTKISDYMPAHYSSGCKVINSLAGDGCIIEGKVENSLLFNGVHVYKDASVKDCIIMRDSKIKDGCRLNCAIACNTGNIEGGFSNLEVRHFPILSLSAGQNKKVAELFQAGILAT